MVSHSLSSPPLSKSMPPKLHMRQAHAAAEEAASTDQERTLIAPRPHALPRHRHGKTAGGEEEDNSTRGEARPKVGVKGDAVRLVHQLLGIGVKEAARDGVHPLGIRQLHLVDPIEGGHGVVERRQPGSLAYAGGQSTDSVFSWAHWCHLQHGRSQGRVNRLSARTLCCCCCCC